MPFQKITNDIVHYLKSWFAALLLEQLVVDCPLELKTKLKLCHWPCTWKSIQLQWVSNHGGAVSDFMKRNLFSIKKGKFDDVMEISLKGATLIVQRHLLLASPAPACLPATDRMTKSMYLSHFQKLLVQIRKCFCPNF